MADLPGRRSNFKLVNTLSISLKIHKENTDSTTWRNRDVEIEMVSLWEKSSQREINLLMTDASETRS